MKLTVSLIIFFWLSIISTYPLNVSNFQSSSQPQVLGLSSINNNINIQKLRVIIYDIEGNLLKTEEHMTEEKEILGELKFKDFDQPTGIIFGIITTRKKPINYINFNLPKTINMMYKSKEKIVENEQIIVHRLIFELVKTQHLTAKDDNIYLLNYSFQI
jgi:hypothetical protein